MTTTLDSALRRLDVADPHASAASPRAQADLASILGDAHCEHSGSPDPGLPSPRRRTVIRLAVGTGAVAAATVGVFVALPSLTGGDRAFASWTGAPTGLTASEATQAGERCREAMLDGAGADASAQLAAAETAIAERRGAWTTVVLAGADGFAATCITDDSTHLFRDMFGSIGAPADHVEPTSRSIEVTDLGVGSARAGDLSVAAGVVGADVTGISYHSAARGDVAATVSGGRFALWLPGSELESASRDGVELTVTYAGGETAVQRVRLGGGPA